MTIRPISKTAHDNYVAACEAVLAYDNSIAGHAARGECKLAEEGFGIAESDLLDELYAGMVNKARKALGMGSSDMLGPTGEPRCPKCGNSFQNAVPNGSPTFLRCAICKNVWEPK